MNSNAIRAAAMLMLDAAGEADYSGKFAIQLGVDRARAWDYLEARARGTTHSAALVAAIAETPGETATSV